MNITKGGPRGSSQYERMIQHVVQVLTVTFIVGGTTMMFNMSKSVAVIETEMKGLQTRIEDLSARMGDRYTRTQAERDMLPIQNAIRDHEARIRELEKHLN